MKVCRLNDTKLSLQTLIIKHKSRKIRGYKYEESNKAAIVRDNSKAALTTIPLKGMGDTYIGGTDVPLGRYVVTAESEKPAFIRADNKIIMNYFLEEDLGTEAGNVPSGTIDVTEGMEIEIGLGEGNVIFTPVDWKEETTTLSAGNWIIGVDFPAGEYTLLASSTYEKQWIAISISSADFTRYYDSFIFSKDGDEKTLTFEEGQNVVFSGHGILTLTAV